MEMYKTTVVRMVRITTVEYQYVFAESQEAAEAKIQDAPRPTPVLNMSAIPPANIKHHIVHVEAELIAPQKGRKRSPLTKIQKKALVKIAGAGDEKARVRFTPQYKQWRIVGAGNNPMARWDATIDERTIVALRKKNLLIPVEMSPKELDAQIALGLMRPGEFIFQLNMKEVQKRKVYQNAQR